MTISIAAEVLAAGDRRAEELRRTRSNYIAWLIEQDVKEPSEEEAGASEAE